MYNTQQSSRKTCRSGLEPVSIPYQTEDRIADFHAAGCHTHITELLRNGVSLVEAKQLARHSDVNMTMRYTHIGINDQAKTVANLPAPKTVKENPEPASSAARPISDALQILQRWGSFGDIC